MYALCLALTTGVEPCSYWNTHEVKIVQYAQEL